MNLTLIRSMTRSAVFELENELCYRPVHPFTVALNGKTVYEACNTNVFSLFSLPPLGQVDSAACSRTVLSVSPSATRP